MSGGDGYFVGGAADAYDDILVPAMFDPWAARVAALLGEGGDTVFDVACGTGVLPPHLIDAGWMRVVGADPSVSMLERAAERTPEAEFVVGAAEDLPFDDAEADAIACSFGLMFMDDPSAALAEMARVTRQGGRMVVSTWGHVDDCPGFEGIITAIEAHSGGKATELLRTAFGMGDPDELAEIADDAGLDAVRVSVHSVDAEFDSLADIAEAYCTSLAIGNPTEAPALEAELARTMAPWMRGDTVAFPVSGLILEARA